MERVITPSNRPLLVWLISALIFFLNLFAIYVLIYTLILAGPLLGVLFYARALVFGALGLYTAVTLFRLKRTIMALVWLYLATNIFEIVFWSPTRLDFKQLIVSTLIQGALILYVRYLDAKGLLRD